MRFLYHLYRELVFFVGNLRRIPNFPFVTWAYEKPGIDLRLVCEALTLTQPGDIGLRRCRGYFSNFTIPGCFKHSWIFVSGANGNDITDCMIVEALEEGVVMRHALYPMHTDLALILRPRNLTSECRQKAVDKACRIVGRPYDTEFKFDIEKSLSAMQTVDPENDSKSAADQFGKFDCAFSCTEVLAYAYWHVRSHLHIFRTKHFGKSIVVPDAFVNNCFEIVWCSPGLTVKQAEDLGLPEEGLELLREYKSRQISPEPTIAELTKCLNSFKIGI